MAQVLRVVALGVSVFAWFVLTLVVLPLVEGGGSSSLLQLAVTAAFLLWLIWAAVAIRYDARA